MASSAELAILLKLNDQMSAGLKRAQGNVNTFGATLTKVGTIAGGFLAANVIANGAARITDFFKSATAAAEEHARVQAQVNAVITSTGGAAGVSAEQVFKLADALQETTRFSDEQIASAEALLLTFTRIGKDIFPEVTQAVLDMSTAMGQDTKTSAIQLGKALQDPVAGLTALRRVGVAFTDDQQKLIKSLVESGRGMEAQKLILAEIKKEFGGSAAALTDWEKLVRRGTIAFEEFQEKAGAVITGGLTALANWLDEHGDDITEFAEKFRPAFEAIQAQVETRIGGIIAVVSSLIETINSVSDLVSDLAHGRWQSAWEDMLSVVTNFGKTLLNNLAAIFGALPNLVIDAVNKAIDAVNNVKIPESIGASIFGVGGSVPIPGGGGGLNIPRVPSIPTTPFSIGGAIEQMAKLGEAANKATPPVRSLVEDFGEGADNAQKYADALKRFQEQMGAAVQSFLSLDKITSAVSALFGKPTREQADLQLQQAQQGVFKARFGDKAVHFGPGEGAGTLAKTEQRLKTLDAEQNLLKARITAANALLLTEQEQAKEAEKLVTLTEAQSRLIREDLNPSVTDLIPELRTAQTEFSTMATLIKVDVGGALLTFARTLSEFKLPELKLPNGGTSSGFVDVQP